MEPAPLNPRDGPCQQATSGRSTGPCPGHLQLQAPTGTQRPGRFQTLWKAGLFKAENTHRLLKHAAHMRPNHRGGATRTALST